MSNPLYYGHAWLSVVDPRGHRVDVGYYPLGFMARCPGELKVGDNRHQATQDAAYTFRIGADQAASLLNRAEEIRRSPGEYTLFEHNCMDVAHELLVVAGIELPNLPTRDGMASRTAWVTGQYTDRAISDPATFNTALQQTTLGREARAEYSNSHELHAVQKADALQELREEAQHEVDDAQGSTYIDLDYPEPLPSRVIELADPPPLTDSVIELDEPPPIQGDLAEPPDLPDPPPVGQVDDHFDDDEDMPPISPRRR